MSAGGSLTEYTSAVGGYKSQARSGWRESQRSGGVGVLDPAQLRNELGIISAVSASQSAGPSGLTDCRRIPPWPHGTRLPKVMGQLAQVNDGS